MNARVFLLSWGMLFMASSISVAGIYLIKDQINNLGIVDMSSFGTILAYFFKLIKNPRVIIGAFFCFSAPLPYVIALSRMELSLAYPAAVAFNCLILLPLSIMCLGEQFTWYKMVGVGLILISLYLLYK